MSTKVECLQIAIPEKCIYSLMTYVLSDGRFLLENPNTELDIDSYEFRGSIYTLSKYAILNIIADSINSVDEWTYVSLRPISNISFIPDEIQLTWYIDNSRYDVIWNINGTLSVYKHADNLVELVKIKQYKS